MTMSAISAQVEDYLVSRRAMGFDLRGEGYQLHAFARFANEQSDAGTLTLELLLRWVQGAVAPGPVTAARRVEYQSEKSGGGVPPSPQAHRRPPLPSNSWISLGRANAVLGAGFCSQ
jgi:hypothetical protein